MSVIVALLFIIHIPTAAAAASVSDERPIFPIAVLCTTPDLARPTLYDIPCQDRSDAYSLYAQHMNQQGGMIVNGVSYTLNMSYFDVGFGANANDITKVYNVAKRLLIENAYGYFPVIIAPYSSLYTLVVAGFGEAAKRVVYASTAVTDLIFQCPSPPNPVLGADCISTKKRPGDRRYQYTFATNPTAVNRWNGLIYNVKVAGAQTLAMIDSSDLASQYTGLGVSAAAVANNLQLVQHRQLQGNETLTDRGLVDNWLAQLRQNWPNLDVLLVNNWADLHVGCGNILLSLRAMNWLPKMVGCVFGPATIDLINMVGDLQQYITSPTVADPRFKITVDPTIYPHDPWVSSIDPNTGNPSQDAPFNAFQSQAVWRAPTAWSIQYEIAMFDMTILQRALAVMQINYTHVNDTSDPHQIIQATGFTDALRQATQGLYEPTWFGRVQFDQVGRLATDAVIGQIKGNTPLTYDIIYPLASQTAPFIYPIPSWDERMYTPSYGQFKSEKWVIGISTVMCAVSLGLAIFVITFRDAHIVKGSSPVFLLCMLLGCILMNSSICTWTLYETNQSCFAHVWLFSVGYILMFAPLFAKTYRLYCIFSSSHLQVQALPDLKLFTLVVAPLLAFELLYLAIWSGVAPFEARTTVVDALRPSYNYDSCYYNNVSQGFFLVSLAYKIAFLVAGCVLIFIARNIPSSFNETPLIGAAIYNVLFTSAILVPIVTTDALGRESRFLVRSFGIMMATLLGQLIIVCPKMYHLFAHGDVKLSLDSKGGTSHDTPKHSHFTQPPTCVEMTTTQPGAGYIGSSSLPARTIASTSTSQGSQSTLARTLGSTGTSPFPPSFINPAYESMTLQQLHSMMMETQHKLALLQAVLRYKQQPGAGEARGTAGTSGPGRTSVALAAEGSGRLSLTTTPRAIRTSTGTSRPPPSELCRVHSLNSLPLSFPSMRPLPHVHLGDRSSSDVSVLHVHIQVQP